MTCKIPTPPSHPPAHPVFKTPPLPSPPRSHYSLPRLPSNSSAHFLSTMAHNLERWDSAELWDAVDGPDLSALAQLSQSILEPSSDRRYSAVSSYQQSHSLSPCTAPAPEQAPAAVIGSEPGTNGLLIHCPLSLRTSFL